MEILLEVFHLSRHHINEINKVSGDIFLITVMIFITSQSKTFALI